MQVSLEACYHSCKAVIHYKAPEEGSSIIDINQVYLCDSGAQYLDGECS